jgi:general secretion pathway protein D
LFNAKGNSTQVGGTATTPLAQEAQASAGGASSSGGSSSEQGAVGGSNGFQGGLSQPYKDMESIAQPMRLILRGSKEQLKRAESMLGILDVAPRMVALEVRVMELSKDDAINVGLDWNIFTGGAVKFIRLQNTVETPSNSVGVNIRDRNFTGDVVGTLDKLSNRNNLIARPNMIAPDGRESELFIGDAIRYVETITSGQNGPSVQIGTVRVGINLSVLPRISADGTMTLDLRPVVSFLTGFKRVSVQGFAAELPQTSERISQQTITMRSGETFAISGLIQSQDVKQLSGIPILMDLPIIGALFRRTTTQTIRRELVVFVTAKSLEGPLTTENSELPMKVDSEAMKPKKAKTEKN